jgi:hypothetical protein
MDREFFKDAIATAKTVKESAIANAKTTLEEEFSPQISALLAQKIEEMENEDVSESSKDDMDEGYDKEDMDEGYDKDDMDESYDKDDMDEGYDKDDINEMADPGLVALATAIGIPATALAADGAYNAIKKAAKKGNKVAKGIVNVLDKTGEAASKGVKEDMDEEMDLDEIISELESEVSEDKNLNEDEETESDEAEGDEAEGDEVEDEEIDIEDMSEEDLKKFIESVIEDMVKAGELEPSEEFEDDVDIETDDGELEIEDDGDTAVDESKMKPSYKGELDEAVKTINTLKSELNEIKVLNAKLLYSNKIFKSESLNEQQKAKILGTFDKVKTVKEAKLVYETLLSNIPKGTKPIKESYKGSASKPISTPPKKKQNIVESNEMVSRFQKLAGITENK